MRIRRASVLLLLAASCRIPLAVDTSGSKFIPREVAVERLKEVLATADAAICLEPKRTLSRAEIREWKVDDLGFEARADGKEPIRVAFKDVTATSIDQLNAYYQLKIFTTAPSKAGKDSVRLNWKLEASVRRALELIDALWKQP